MQAKPVVGGELKQNFSGVTMSVKVSSDTYSSTEIFAFRQTQEDMLMGQRSRDDAQIELEKWLQILWYSDFTIQYPPHESLYGTATASIPSCVELAKSISMRFPKETAAVCSYDLFSREIAYGRCLALAWFLEIDYWVFRRRCLKKGLLLPFPSVEESKSQWLRAINSFVRDGKKDERTRRYWATVLLSR